MHSKTHFKLPFKSSQQETALATALARSELIAGEFAGGGIFTTRPTQPGAYVGLARRADHRREGRRRRPWRHGRAERRRYADGSHGSPT